MKSRIKTFDASTQYGIGFNEYTNGDRADSTRTLPVSKGNCVISVVESTSSINHKNSIMVLDIENENELRKFYKAMIKGGTVKFELQETSMGVYQAIFSDALGVTWNLNYSSRN